MAHLITTALVAASLLPTILAQGTCYFPNGSPSPNDFVCNSTTSDGFSSCCGTQVDGSPAYCMSNGLCLSDMFLSRGSCTDKSWNSKNCAQVCTNTDPSGGVGIRPCGYNGTWDCGDGSGCQTSAIKINTGTFELTNAQLNQMGAQKIPSSSSTASPTSNPASSSTAAPATVTATPTGLVESSSVAAVGAGVGVPLGILAASFLALWLLERRKAGRLQQQLAFQHHQFQQAPGAGPAASYHHQSMSAPTLNRMPSQHSAVMSPISAPPPPVPGHGQQHPAMAMQRMVSTSSQHHPAYQNMGAAPAYESAPPPPPPPKAFGGQSWAAEAPGEDVRGHPAYQTQQGHQRNFSSAQELPTDR